ncbi:unnamed protein product [Lactuca saligna]|uniref:Uncharacterized protein n=1 Tax=Lactuca saligna TaxID=75948 RepID=A0AA35ZS00_LACSI|nr:unnamed protein product [Lactuca saligna]
MYGTRTDDDLIDFSFLDFALETFKPTSNLSDDPFLNILCDENMLRRTVDGMVDDGNEVGVKELQHDHIDDQNDCEVGVELNPYVTYINVLGIIILDVRLVATG